MRRSLALAAAGLVTLTALLWLGPVPRSILIAHPGPHPPAPPTYDYDTALPGTQGPTALVLSNPTGRFLQSLRLAVNAIVPTEDLQAILPAGFTASMLPPPNAPGQSAVGLLFDFQGRCEHIAGGTVSGPASGVFAVHTAFNMGLARNELLILASEFSDPSYVDCVNANWGPGSARLAEVKVRTREDESGRLRLTFDVKDKDIDLRLKTDARANAPIVARGFHADPAGVPQRSLDEGLFANAAYRFSVMADNLVVPAADAKAKLNAGDGDMLGLPGGRVRVIGIGPNVTFFRWYELFYQPE
jgi:hypothetical protein